MKKSTTRTAVIVICLIAAMVGYFAYLSNKSRESQAEKEMTMVQSTLSRNMTTDYPPTPKEVIKYYNDILRCFYNEEHTDEELNQLGCRARELYDAELLEQNELGTYMMRLGAEIQEYKDKKRRITGTAVAASTNVDLFSEDGYDFARLQSNYSIIEGGEKSNTIIVYLLRKDAQKRWKIYGWTSAENVTVGKETE